MAEESLKMRAVQFLHAGGNPPVISGEPPWLIPRLCEAQGLGMTGYTPWNSGRRHFRKFMASSAKVIRGIGEKPESDVIGFWGEWEPPSLVRRLSGSEEHHPRHLHWPVLVNDGREWLRRFPVSELPSCSTESNACMNTDPFVFGDTFYYSNCRQESRPLLRHLDVGSVILFGSRLGSRGHWGFVLDTVFVIGDRIAWPDDMHEAYRRTPSIYHQACLDLLSRDVPLTIYAGAMHSTSTGGDAYCFVPCKPLTGSPDGFSRPVLRRLNTLGFISQGMTQGVSTAILQDPEMARRVWEEVVDEVTRQGYQLGVEIDLPWQGE